jgi:hypothetical protein
MVADDHTTLTSPQKLAFFVRRSSTLWAIISIIAPLSVLATNSISDKTKLFVLLISLVAFSIAIQVAARPRNLELFVVTVT